MMRQSRPLSSVGSSTSNQRPSLTGRPSLATKRQSGVQPSDDARRSRGMSLSSRRSSVMPGGGRKHADPRPIGNKSYTTESIRKLITYLTEHGYDRSISPKILQSPTTKDFLNIISFLLRSIDPNYTLVGKLEDEVPAVLRTLGYPGTVSKGALSAVGVPHTWPQLLAVLTWLVDILKYTEAVNAKGIADSFDNDDGDKMFIEYLTQGYQLFLAGEDDMSGLEEQIQSFFYMKNESLKHDIHALQAANAEQATQLDALTSGETPLQKAQALNADLRSDTAKFEKHTRELIEYRAKMTERVKAVGEEYHAREAELATTMKEIEACKAVVAKQELSASDVQRMNAEREHLLRELAQLKENKASLSKLQWEAEETQKTQLDRLEAKVQEANNKAMHLQAVGGKKQQLLEMRPHELQHRPEHLLSADVEAELKPELVRLKANIATEMATTQDELLEAERLETKREDEREERLKELSARVAELQRLEKEEKMLREQHERDLQACQRETDALYEQINSVRSSAGSSLLHSQNELAALQQEYDEFMREAEKARKKLYDQVIGVLNTLLTHKDQVTHQLKDLSSHCDARSKQLEPLVPALEAARAARLAEAA